MTDGVQRRAASAAALGAVTISAAPVLVVLLLRAGMGPTSAATWRVVIGGVTLLAGSALLGRRLLPPPAARRSMAIAAIAFAADLWVWHRSIDHVGAGMATILGNTQVFWSAVIGRVLFAEAITRRLAIAAIIAFVGVVLLTGIGSEIDVTGAYLAGVGYGLATGLAYASFILALRHANGQWQDETVSPLTRAGLSLGWTLVFAGILLTVATILEGDLDPPPDARAWIVTIALGLVVQIGGWLLISPALPRLPAARAGIILLIQPALATIWGAAFFQESLEALQIAGALATLTGVYLGVTTRRTR